MIENFRRSTILNKFKEIKKQNILLLTVCSIKYNHLIIIFFLLRFSSFFGHFLFSSLSLTLLTEFTFFVIISLSRFCTCYISFCRSVECVCVCVVFFSTSLVWVQLVVYIQFCLALKQYEKKECVYM